jgi:hypothetical protein
VLFSAENYTKAMSNLAKDISDFSLASVDITLAACILFAVYASLRGDRRQLTIHVRQGLKVVRQSTTDVGQRGGVVHFASRQLAMFHLAQQMRAPVFESVTTPGQDIVALNPAGKVLNHIDCDEMLDDLAVRVQAIGNAVYTFTRSCNTGVYSGREEFRDDERQAIQIQSRTLRRDLVEALKNQPSVRGFKLLRARFELSWIMLQVGWTLYQTPFDRYISNFAMILQLAEDVLEPSGTDREPLPFSVNLGLIPILFYVARLCRERDLRRKAVDLLDVCPRVEGLWNAREAAAVARFVIALEESTERPDVEEDYWSDVRAQYSGISTSEDRRVHSLHFGGAAVDNDGTPGPLDLLDLKIMTRPEAMMAQLKTTHYQIRCSEWADGRGDISKVVPTK